MCVGLGGFAWLLLLTNALRINSPLFSFAGGLFKRWNSDWLPVMQSSGWGWILRQCRHINFHHLVASSRPFRISCPVTYFLSLFSIWTHREVVWGIWKWIGRLWKRRGGGGGDSRAGDTTEIRSSTLCQRLLHQNDEFKAVFIARFHVRWASRLSQKYQYSILTVRLVQCICRNINCAQGKRSLHSRWNISTFTEFTWPWRRTLTNGSEVVYVFPTC